MNYLELCQRVTQECGISGAGPSAVINQTGVYKKIVDWVASSWREIQLEQRYWQFMWSEYSFDTIGSPPTGLYTIISLPVRDFKKDPVVVYHKATGLDDRGFIPYLSYYDWYQKYAASNLAASRPVCWTVMPDGQFRLTPDPDDVYVISGNGLLKVQSLVDQDDAPVMPEDYHLAIVWHVAEKWFATQEAEQRRQTAQMHYDEIKGSMLRDQLPAPQWGFDALA